MTFKDKLSKSVKKNRSLLCVGLDPDSERIPDSISGEDRQFEFLKAIVNATSDLVCAFKPNSAFFEAEGANGIEQLKKVCDYINSKHPEIPIILDAKRADIGNTNVGYVQYAFDYLEVDAITVSPYLGSQTLEPFLSRADKGIIVLCRTSNPGADEFQDLLVDGEPLYKIVAKTVKDKWNTNKNCLLVVGATYPKELAEVRAIVGDDINLLVPGLGAQGGEAEASIKAGMNSRKEGMIVNSSRSIIFASGGSNFADSARDAALKARQDINKARGIDG